MTVQEIINRALWLGKHSVYWYGGKRQVPTVELAKRLKLNNPSVWNTEYYEAALKDVGSGKYVCDCSGLVCYAYGINDIGTSQFASKFEEVAPLKYGKYIPGSVAWRSGHCGIIIDEDGHVAEMRGLKWDFCTNRTFTSGKFTKCYVLPGIVYSTRDPGHAPGWHKDNVGWWYATGWNPGEYYRSGFYSIDDNWYYFNADGYIQTGIFKADGLLFASDEYGILATSARTRVTSVTDLKACCSLRRIHKHD